MEVLLSVLDEALLSDLECPECMEYMAPPIKLCTNGHNICSKCREEVDCCPTCRAEFSNIRNVALGPIQSPTVGTVVSIPRNKGTQAYG